MGSHVQVVFESNPGVWFRCTVVKLDPLANGFNVKLQGHTYFIPCTPRESWRNCEKECKLKTPLTQEEINIVSKED